MTAETPKLEFADQGAQWTADLRQAYYTVDQGARMIPLAWLKALNQADGKPFLDDSLTRYGFLMPDKGPSPDRLPIGFTTADSPQGPMAGMTCAACHVRDLKVGGETYRIDGGPAFADFGAFTVDLDDAVHRALASKPAFAAFAAQVLGPAMVQNPNAVAKLRAEVEVWWVGFHAWISLSLPKDRPWGPTRLDAMGMIFNRIAGLDVGPAPTYLLPENIERADAPVRYPFLWNSPKQDFTQWAAFDPNGNDLLAMIRNLGQVYGVFAQFHPQSTVAAFTPLNRNYLADNSANFAGLGEAENLLKRIGPPKWPWALDQALAKRGEAVFKANCAECHGIADGIARPEHTWRTRIEDVGTDTRQWQVLMRQVGTGSMAGAALQGAPPLPSRAGSLDLLKVAVLGTIFDVRAAQELQKQEPGAKPPASPQHVSQPKPASPQQANEAKPPAPPSHPPINVYEGKVLQGIWAAAPYLHNGSVPTLADLLEPPDRRPKRFQIGPAYDPAAVGLARRQAAGAFTLNTTGCEDRASGDSHCGHTYGTALPPEDKRALLEYLKAH